MQSQSLPLVELLSTVPVSDGSDTILTFRLKLPRFVLDEWTRVCGPGFTRVQDNVFFDFFTPFDRSDTSEHAFVFRTALDACYAAYRYLTSCNNTVAQTIAPAVLPAAIFVTLYESTTRQRYIRTCSRILENTTIRNEVRAYAQMIMHECTH